MNKPWLTVVETEAYLADAERVLSESERDNVVALLAKDPECGDIITGTNGIRKVRMGVDGRGKSGGARVVYFFFNASFPVYLLALFAKNQKANLSKAERNALAKFVTNWKKTIRKRSTHAE